MQSVTERAPLAIERSLVRLATWLAGIAAVGYALTGWYAGDMAVVAGAIGPALVTALGVVTLRTGYDRVLPFLMVAALVIVAQNRLLGIEDIANAAVIPLAIIGITGAFFVPGRFVIPYVAAYTTLVFVARIQWSGDQTRFLQAAIAAISVAFGATLLAWIRREFGHREDRYHSLFEHAPISLWKEDFTDVGAEINELTNRGISDLAAYLEANPEEVRRLATLVRVTDVNDAAVRLTEAPDRNMLLGSFRMETFSRGALESFVSQFLAIANDTEKVSVELKGGLTVMGRPIEALVVWSAPRVDGALDLSNVTVAIVDITRQREVERRLQDLIQSKDQFVATISHELRTPLTAVVGIAEELRHENGSIDDAERGELLELVAEQSLEVSRIVDDLLVVARADAGNLIVATRPVDLAAEAIGVIQSIDPGVTIETVGSPVVAADPQRVRQIVRNLVTNAQRYGGPNIRVVIGDEGARGIVEVRDDGEALSPASRNEIFEPYARAKQRSGVTASVGLGLTVSRRLAQHMGGDLTYDHDGDETIFSLTLAGANRTVPVARCPES